MYCQTRVFPKSRKQWGWRRACELTGQGAGPTIFHGSLENADGALGYGLLLKVMWSLLQMAPEGRSCILYCVRLLVFSKGVHRLYTYLAT